MERLPFHHRGRGERGSELVGGTPQIHAGDYTLFITLQNQNGQGLPAGFTMTQQDTNNLGSGRVPDDQNFSFWELGVTIEPERQDVVAGSTAGAVSLGNVHPDDVDRILSEGVLQVQYLTSETRSAISRTSRRAAEP